MQMTSGLPQGNTLRDGGAGRDVHANTRSFAWSVRMGSHG